MVNAKCFTDDGQDCQMIGCRDTLRKQLGEQALSEWAQENESAHGRRNMFSPNGLRPSIKRRPVVLESVPSLARPLL
jgi:hypothetical protein